MLNLIGKAEFKKEMYKILRFSWVVSAASVVLPILASAAVSGPPSGLPDSPANTIGGVFKLVCGILNWIFYGLVVLTIFFVLMAAFKYLMANGDAEKVKESNQELLYAAAAIVVGILARVIPSIAASLIGVPPADIGGC